VVADPASPQAAVFRDIAKKIVDELGGAANSGASIESLLKKIKQPFTGN
jgi:ATP-binding protein involved in chromosome partitioning